MTTRIYTQQSLTPDMTCILLESAPSHHLLRVLRFKVGGELVIFDGRGGEYQATLEEVQSKKALCRIERFVDVSRESWCYTELGIALLSGSKIDLVIQKAVELGVNKVTPLLTNRIAANVPSARMESRLVHWQGVVVSASEQCGRTTLAEVVAPEKFERWCTKDFAGLSLIADFDAPALAKVIQQITEQEALRQCRVAIGPEGGFTKEEITQAKQHNFTGTSLGPTVLRAETAAIATLAILRGQTSLFNQD